LQLGDWLRRSHTGDDVFALRVDQELTVELIRTICRVTCERYAGTGIVASALVAARTGRVKAPVSVTAASGDVLTVDFNLSGDTATDVTLLGPAAHVFQGTVVYPKG
jgi:diaminopimelate epimerase